MNPFTSATVQCPYCWEPIEISIDASVSHQEYVEDCPICCRPILVTVATEHGEVVAVNAQAENE
ncbi:MAG TPA: CPXCG motif-containing cysteine-rich protein [Kiritimatiellia bacterium]|mgnify:CR=1 FL=1|nr:CPXCG motif-containing cysteine-rich protein [Kiritimatiellia bacterium]HMP00411.1 CPXCG motif-containing cysteine-rich protein [Kiritimatiellia bacterium]HMP97836.1 CPXCG motif-containing cysteine-rich protein [Kiritimatiellia bacterium]